MQQADTLQAPHENGEPQDNSIRTGNVTDSGGVAVGYRSQAFTAGDVRGSIVQAQGSVGAVISTEVLEIHQIPNKIPVSNRQAIPPPDTYVPRLDGESKLGHLLTRRSNQLSLVGLYGPRGVGKTLLGRKMAMDLQEEFPDGTLWADLEAMTPNDILANFTEPFDPSFDHLSKRSGGQYLKYFQSALGEKRVLIVLDQAKDASLFDKLVPHDCPNVAVLVISSEPLQGLSNENSVYLPEMNPDEAIRLFHNLWNGVPLFNDDEAIRDLAEQLSYIPKAIEIVARDMVTSPTSPVDYRDDLRRRKQTGGSFASLYNPWLDAVFKNLPYDARQIFPFLGVLGEGIWTLDVIANVSRLKRESVLLGLRQLAEKRLVTRITKGRFQCAPMVHDFALEKLKELGGDALIRASRTMLGQYFLIQNQQIVSRYRQELLAEFLANDVQKQEFLQELNRTFLPHESTANIPVRSLAKVDLNLSSLDLIVDVFESVVLKSKVFVAAWSERLSAQSLTDAKPHLKDSLNWALEQEDWGLVRRYANLTSDNMFFDYEISKAGEDKADVSIELDFSLFRNWMMSDVSLTSRLTASRWVNFLAKNCEFISTNWAGVRLERAQFIDVDMVGSKALGTVFMNSLFERVDLRNADLRGTIFYNCSFLEVNFRNSSLQQVEFINTSFQKIDFRNTVFEFIEVRGDGRLHVAGRISPVEVSGDTVPYDETFIRGTNSFEGLFEPIYRKIETLDDAIGDKDVVEATVKGIEKETAKGEQANPSFIERGLKTLALMASDIFDLTIDTLTNPLLGISTVAKKIAEKAKQEAGK